MDGAGWDYTNFEDMTLLDRSIYYRIKKEEITPKIETVVAICIGLAAYWRTSEELLMLSGNQFDASMAHHSYKMILMFYANRGIDYCNDLLRELGIEPLGTR
jgi:hypothetical protein